MSKNRLFFVFVLFFLVAVIYMARGYFEDRIDTYKDNLSSNEAQINFYKFLSIHDKEPIFIDLVFSKEQNMDFNLSIKQSPDIYINSLISNSKEIKYIFKIREDGKKDFIYDFKTKTLKGLFMPYIQNIDKNKTIINMISLTPNEVKKIK